LISSLKYCSRINTYFAKICSYLYYDEPIFSVFRLTFERHCDRSLEGELEVKYPLISEAEGMDTANFCNLLMIAMYIEQFFGYYSISK